jgi:hypothetical protein
MLRSCAIRMVRVVASDRPLVPPESSFLEDLSVAGADTMHEPELGRGDRTGLMIIRAWVEEGSRAPLRVQLRLTTDVSEGFQQTLNLSDIEAASAAVERWLSDVLAEPTSPD